MFTGRNPLLPRKNEPEVSKPESGNIFDPSVGFGPMGAQYGGNTNPNMIPVAGMAFPNPFFQVAATQPPPLMALNNPFWNVGMQAQSGPPPPKGQPPGERNRGGEKERERDRERRGDRERGDRGDRGQRRRGRDRSGGGGGAAGSSSSNTRGWANR